MTKRAILIAVEYLPASRDGRDQPLETKGCINDIEAINAYLCKSLGFLQENIYKLISYLPTRGLFTESAHLPTYSNIVETFRHLREASSEDDLAYVHFSGPVCLVPSRIREARILYRHDYGLQLLDGTLGRSYLHESELALLLRELAAKGPEVCVTLDPREGQNTYSSAHFRDTRFTQNQLSEMAIKSNFHLYENTWLRYPHFPHSYTMLSLSEGLNPPSPIWDASSKQFYGVLTYFLLLILRRNVSHLTWNDIAWEISLETEGVYKSKYALSNVISSGTTEKPFLRDGDGRVMYPPLRFSSTLILDAESLRLIIEAGTVHGILQGVTGYFFPLERESRTKKLPREHASAKFKITSVNQLFSRAELCDLAAVIKDFGSPAGHHISIQGVSTIQRQDIWGQCSWTAKEQVELYHSRLGIHGAPSVLASHVNVYVVGGYDIKYRNPNSQTTRQAPMPTPTRCLHLLSGDCVTILLSNKVNEPLYVHLLHFDSAFGISKICSNQNNQRLTTLSCETDPPYRLARHLSFEISLSLPSKIISDENALKATEVIKVVITNRPSSFYSLGLRSIQDREFLRTHQDPLAQVSVTGVESGSSAENITNIFRSEPYSKYIQEVPDLRDDWCCFDMKFVLHKAAESLRDV